MPGLIVCVLVLLCAPISSATDGSALFQPIPLDDDYHRQKALLGKILFKDVLLSQGKNYACVSCHDVYSSGAENRPFSIGNEGRITHFNTPTVFNARYNFHFTWNGRHNSLREHTIDPLLSDKVMGIDSVVLEQRLNASSDYRSRFTAVFDSGPITTNQVVEALIEFQKALTTPNSAFDRYLRGEAELNPDQMQGYELFRSYGCSSCHNGINIGTNSFQRFGVFTARVLDDDIKDRFSVTGREQDKSVFRVPGLRNVELTAPYFHDGSAQTLDEAIEIMANGNLNRKIPKQDRNYIAAFLKSLTGELPAVLN